ncbi:hypothetical protein [Ruminococcus sp.]|uniref:hypothetical protein n=1 Tax=Ruminococcus sp. TaxID=41978 RepID=UPI0025E20CC5|nr:hypothetical protein [Ruminococcus sp.]
MKQTWKKTIAGLTATAMLIPGCIGTAYAAPIAEIDAEMTLEMPVLDEPMPEDVVDAQVDATIASAAPQAEMPIIDGAANEALVRAEKRTLLAAQRA